jgi:hypothetical protein
MPVPANLYQKASLRGSREDLIDKIFNTDKDETPLSSAFGKTKARTDFHEWQRDAYAAPDANNAAIDGDDSSMAAQTPTERVGNHCQTFKKVYGVSGRAEVVMKAGRESEIKYLRGMNMVALKRDVEAMIVSTNPAVAATTSVAGKAGGLAVQLYQNALHNGTGATAAWTSGAPTTAITAGTNRAFTQALFNSACQSLFVNSGKFAKVAVMSPSHKTTFSGFSGIAQNRFEVRNKDQGTVVAGADVFVSDFGAIDVLPHYMMVGSTNVYLLNPDYIELADLRGFKTEALAKTGDSEKEHTLYDVTLCVRSSKTQAKIADLTP